MSLKIKVWIELFVALSQPRATNPDNDDAAVIAGKLALVAAGADSKVQCRGRSLAASVSLASHVDASCYSSWLVESRKPSELQMQKLIMGLSDITELQGLLVCYSIARRMEG
jgi:hypothetical protein